MQRLTGSDAGLQMPPTGALPPDEIAVLRAWIDSGADMPGRAAEAVVVERPTDPRVQTFIDAIAAHDLAAVRKALATDKTLARSADGSDSTALMHGAYAGSVEIMEALLDAGADVQASNRRKATALHWAISDPAKAKLLLMKGADVNAKTVDGRTPLHAAAALPLGAPVVRLLLEVGADVDSRTITGNTPLFGAVTAGVEITRLLLEKGADVNATDYRGYTPLMHAAQYDRDSPEIVRLLLRRGANVNVKAEGQTAVSIAARRGDTELARLLREAAAAARTTGSRQ